MNPSSEGNGIEKLRQEVDRHGGVLTTTMEVVRDAYGGGRPDEAQAHEKEVQEGAQGAPGETLDRTGRGAGPRGRGAVDQAVRGVRGHRRGGRPAAGRRDKLDADQGPIGGAGAGPALAG